MPDLADYDAVTKELKKIFDTWSKAMKDAARSAIPASPWRRTIGSSTPRHTSK